VVLAGAAQTAAAKVSSIFSMICMDDRKKRSHMFPIVETIENIFSERTCAGSSG
jgi:Tfp pilus assembly ATPase PilU